MAKTVDNCDQDAGPQGGFPGNPNASGANATKGNYRVLTTGRFDDNTSDTGEGQITSHDNDGYPYPDGWILKQKGTA